MTTDRPADKIETRFERVGSLEPPKLVGRLVRLFFGVWLLFGLYTLLRYGWEILVDTDAPARLDWWAFMAIAFWLTPYVVNIGFTKNWRRKPQLVLIAAATIAVGLDLVLYGAWWAPPLGALVWVWLFYFSAHLGLSFVLSTILATPGCEMRAIPHLWTRLTGRKTAEHYCPGWLDQVDRWESTRSP